MRLALAVLAVLPLLAGCGATAAGACQQYVRAYNRCAGELDDASLLGGAVAADAFCLAYTLPGVTASPEIRDAFLCQAEAYDLADCSSAEALGESLEGFTCDEVPEA